ncbi:hypothetical protein [Thalassovita sp.]|uniref:hypothetical protein n=1 Tax=Thalassovita sp. TaxID=1979401 RepID=UPI0029DE82C2|nr:hypothetical protein [Thalassovita sp.]
MLLFDDFVADPAARAPALPLEKTDPDQHVLLVSLSTTTRGVLLTVRGKGQGCCMILRTRTMRPGQGYLARFLASPDWQTLNLALGEFQPVGGVLRRHPRPEALHAYTLRSETEAELSVARVSFY